MDDQIFLSDQETLFSIKKISQERFLLLLAAQEILRTNLFQIANIDYGEIRWIHVEEIT